MVLARRFVVLSAFALWMGGLTFYAGFVINIAHRVLGGGHEFGFVTAEVTSRLHLFGLAASAVLLANLWADRRPAGPPLAWGLLGTWLVVAATLAGLFVLHARLGGVIAVETHTVTDRVRFRALHERYQLVLGIHWLAAAAHAGLVLAAWRRADRASPGRTGSPPPVS
jgi:hypothetical protein